MSSSAARLYEEDFLRWTEEQSSALRDAARIGTNLPLDWENLVEEVESSGRSQRHELRRRIAVILEHLLKLERSPAADPRRGWMETIARQRSDSELVLNDSPSLKGDVARIIAEESSRVARLTSRMLRLYGEDVGNIAPPTYTEEQVLGDWYPGDLLAPPPRSQGRESGGSCPSRGACGRTRRPDRTKRRSSARHWGHRRCRCRRPLCGNSTRTARAHCPENRNRRRGSRGRCRDAPGPRAPAGSAPSRRVRGAASGCPRSSRLRCPSTCRAFLSCRSRTPAGLAPSPASGHCDSATTG